MIYSEYLAPGSERREQLTPTPADIEGPFYKADSPFRDDITEGIASGRLQFTGVVWDVYGEPVADAVLDVWQASPEGEYDNEGFRFRGKMKCDGGGWYSFVTVRPGCYAISEGEFRCPHIHVKVFAPGYRNLTTQLYFPDGDHNGTDRWFSRDRMVRVDGENASFNFILSREPN